jgi:hypothetical protein
MATETPNIGAPLWEAAQASPWLIQNLAARIWDAMAVATIVERMDLTAPPVSCADGARFLVHGTATGLWTSHEGQLAIAIGANASNGWDYAEIAVESMLLRNRADNTNYRYTSGVWAAFADAVSRFQDLLDVDLTGLVDGMVFVWDASNGVLFPTTIANLIGSLAGVTLDTDVTLAANSDTRVASQKAVRAFVLAQLAGFLELQGGLDCSANPNYPAASKGDYYYITVAGKIGGGAGTTVLAGDVVFATADNAGGTQAAVGSSWDVIRSAAAIVPGVSRLHDLTDVDLTGLADGNVLKYDASNGTFYFAQDVGWPFASAAEIRAGQESGKTIAPDQLAVSALPQTLTDAAPTQWDMSLGYNAKWTLGASRTLATPTNPIKGMTYSLDTVQDSTGSRIVTWPAAFDWGTTGSPTLTTTANKRDRITLFCTDAATPKFDAFLSGKGFS